MSQNQENQANKTNQTNQTNQTNRENQITKLFEILLNETFINFDMEGWARNVRQMAEDLNDEREKAEKEKIEKEKAEKAEKAEKERAEKERAEKERAEKERAEKAEKERTEKENLVFGAGKSLFEVSNLHWAADSFKKYFIGENILECPRFGDDPKDFNIQKIQKVHGNFVVLIDPKYIQGRKTVNGFLYQITQKNGTFLLVFSVNIDHLKTVGKEYLKADQIVKIENVSKCVYVVE